MVNPHQTAARGLHVWTDTLFKGNCCNTHATGSNPGPKQSGGGGENETWGREIWGEKAMLRQITFNELAALSEQDSILNKTWKREKKALVLIQQLVTSYDILRDSPLSSEWSPGRPFPLHQIDYTSEPSNTVPRPTTSKAPRWRLPWPSGLWDADKQLDFPRAAKQLHKTDPGGGGALIHQAVKFLPR